MRIEDLNVVNAVFSELNLSKVARRFRISQSNVSKIVRRVEEEFGFALFERKGFKGLHPTSQGLLLFERLQRFSRSWEDTVALMQSRDSERKDLKVTGPGLYMRNVFLPAWFASQLPERYRLAYMQSRLDQISITALAGDLDLVITPTPVELLDWVAVPVFVEKFAVFTADPEIKSLASADLTGRQWVAYRASSDLIQRFFDDHRIAERNITAYIDDFESILDILRSRSDLLSLLPTHASLKHPGLSMIPVKTMSGQKLYLMYRKEARGVPSVVKSLRAML